MIHCDISIIHLLTSHLTLTITGTIVDGGRKTFTLLSRCIMINEQCIQLLGSHRYMCFGYLVSPPLVLAVGVSFEFLAASSCFLVGAVTPSHSHTGTPLSTSLLRF